MRRIRLITVSRVTSGVGGYQGENEFFTDEAAKEKPCPESLGTQWGCQGARWEAHVTIINLGLSVRRVLRVLRRSARTHALRLARFLLLWSRDACPCATLWPSQATESEPDNSHVVWCMIGISLYLSLKFPERTSQLKTRIIKETQIKSRTASAMEPDMLGAFSAKGPLYYWNFLKGLVSLEHNYKGNSKHEPIKETWMLRALSAVEFVELI